MALLILLEKDQLKKHLYDLLFLNKIGNDVHTMSEMIVSKYEMVHWKGLDFLFKMGPRSSSSVKYLPSYLLVSASEIYEYEFVGNMYGQSRLPIG